MNDCELLELAAKAHGNLRQVEGFGWIHDLGDGRNGAWWRPLEDDRDALRLAVKLRIGLHWCSTGRVYAYADGDVEEYESTREEPDSSVRRAIVRAAAAIGQAMP